MDHRLHNQERREHGAAGVEYAILAGVIAVSILLGATAIGIRLDAIFMEVADAF